MSEGRKYDTGKLQFRLIPPEIKKYLAEILTYGANKYTVNHNFTSIQEFKLWLKNQNLQNVIQIEKYSLKECVEVVTKKILEKQIQNTQNVKEQMLVIGQKKIKIDLKNIENKDILTLFVENEIKKHTDETILVENMDYQIETLQVLNNDKITLVPYVDNPWTLPKPYILTTIMTPDMLEVFYVVNVTTDLDSLTKILHYLQKQLPTYKVLQNLKQSGANNWQKIKIERYYDALERHMNAFQLGEENDEESGMHHLKHALTNMMFITWLELNKPKG